MNRLRDNNLIFQKLFCAKAFYLHYTMIFKEGHQDMVFKEHNGIEMATDF